MTKPDSSWLCLDPLPEPTLVVSVDGTIQFANRAAKRLLELQAGDKATSFAVDVSAFEAMVSRGRRSADMTPASTDIVVRGTAHQYTAYIARLSDTDTLVRLKHKSSSPTAFAKLNRRLQVLTAENTHRRESHARLTAVIDGLPFAVRLESSSGFFFTNEAFRQWFGSELPDIDFADGDDFALDTDDPRYYTVRRFTAQPVEEEIQCAVFVDITDRRHAEDERELMHQSILQAQKLESLGVLSGGIAHDFNNLLVGMLGNAELALLDKSLDIRSVGCVRDIVSSAQRASELCMQLLAYSGKGRFVIEKINLNDIVSEMLTLLELSLSKKASLQLHFDEKLPSVEADATQIRQVLMNLITNASEALLGMPGTVSIATGSLIADVEYLQRAHLVSELTPGRYVWAEVTDTGTGMDKETQERVFDPFFTTKFTGRGLGLAAVSGIVRGHRGAMKMYSEVGVGTTFKLLLPAVDGAPTLRAEPEPFDAMPQGSGTVLVIDDEPFVRSVASKAAKVAGFEVLEAPDGESGVAIFERELDTIVAVLLDMSMPGITGEETFRRMRLIKPDVRVILSSGYNEQEATSRFVGKGLAGFLQKPYGVSTLIEMLVRASTS